MSAFTLHIPADPVPIGTAFEGGFYGGRIISHGGLKIYGVAWAPKAVGEVDGPWLKKTKDVPAAASCWHSMDNTRAMAAAGSELAERVLALDIGGARDWCIPARDALELGYRNLKPTADENSSSWRDGDNGSSWPIGYPYTDDSPAQTGVELFRAGGAEAFDPIWHWSSTQYSASGAYGQDFGYGYSSSYDKSYEGRVRACRLILLNP